MEEKAKGGRGRVEGGRERGEGSKMTTVEYKFVMHHLESQNPEVAVREPPLPLPCLEAV